MSSKGRGIAAAAITACISLVLAACGDGPINGSSGSGEAVIGAPLAMTGAAASVGLDVKNGAQLAVDDINAGGGIGGRKLKLVVKDTAGEPAQAVQLTTSFARDKNVVAVLGPINAPEVGAVTNLGPANKIVIFPPVSSGAVPGVDHGRFNNWTFRINQAIPLTVGPQMSKILQLTGAKRVTILNYDDNPAFVDVAGRWASAARQDGAQVQQIQFPSATQDFSSIVTKIDRSAGLIALGALSATDAQLARAIRQAGIKAQLMGESSILSSEVYVGSRKASEGAYAYSGFVPGATAASTAFQNAFQKKFGKTATSLNAYSYEAVELMAHAVGDGKLTRDAIRQGLSTLKSYQGVTGVLSYDRGGDVNRTSVPLVQVVPGGGIKQVAGIVPLTSQ